MLPQSKIFVAGHRGLVGSAIMRKLSEAGFGNVITRSRTELDLRNQAAVESFFAAERPEFVFLAAAKVGGIMANSTYPAEFIFDNLAIQTNVIHEAYRAGVKKLLFLGSSCIYPKFADQPIQESALLTGALEPTNEPYAVAKIAGIKLCEAYAQQYGWDAVCLMPTNLYGPGDNDDLQNSHVLPALLRRFHEAKQAGTMEVVVWGTGTPRREFLYVDDLAAAAIHVMKLGESPRLMNVGWGEDLAIRDLVDVIRKVVGYTGEIVFDASKPDGTPRKLLDSGRIHATGWRAQIELEEGIQRTYRAYRADRNG